MLVSQVRLHSHKRHNITLLSQLLPFIHLFLTWFHAHRKFFLVVGLQRVHLGWGSDRVTVSGIQYAPQVLRGSDVPLVLSIFCLRCLGVVLCRCHKEFILDCWVSCFLLRIQSCDLVHVLQGKVHLLGSLQRFSGALLEQNLAHEPGHVSCVVDIICVVLVERCFYEVVVHANELAFVLFQLHCLQKRVESWLACTKILSIQGL